MKFYQGLCLSLISALTLFLFLFGISFLAPANYSWILTGDSNIFFYGFNFYNSEPWLHPIGKILTYSFPESTSVVYTDSIPFLSILSKLLFKGLIFQFEGSWILLCFMLQASLSYCLLIKNKVGTLASVFGSILFLTLPTFLNRTLEDTKHYSLLAHFIILLGLGVYSLSKYKKNLKCWLSLFALSLGVHLYLTFIIGVFFLLSFSKEELIALLKTKKLYASLAALAVLSYELGYFMIPLGNSTAGGFGTYSMSLTSLFDSMGRSRFLPAIPHLNEYHEGYQYLGLGFILFFALSLFIVHSRNSLKTEIQNIFRTHWIPIFALIILALSFQLSLFNLKLPEIALISVMTVTYLYFRKKEGASFARAISEEILLICLIFACGKVFRATGRLFWPIEYLALFLLLKSKPNVKALAVITIIQLVDLTPFFQEIKSYNERLSEIKTPILPTVLDKSGAFDHISYVGTYYIPPSAWFHYALTHHKTMGPLPVARASSKFRSNEKEKIVSELESLRLKPRVLYLVGDENLWSGIETHCADSPALCAGILKGNEAGLNYLFTAAIDPK